MNDTLKVKNDELDQFKFQKMNTNINERKRRSTVLFAPSNFIENNLRLKI